MANYGNDEEGYALFVGGCNGGAVHDALLVGIEVLGHVPVLVHVELYHLVSVRQL